jgi:flavin-dependent dehydrogenase
LENHISDTLELYDGSQIAVIGGGPAGSFFTYFTLDLADRYGIDINIDIIEGKDFTCTGPSGCNHCGGIISESLVQHLATEGINIPSNVIRRGIESYTLHLENGRTVIETPLKEQRIASVYRGFGPKGSLLNDYESFDNFLLQLCKKNGANLIQDRVISLERDHDGIILKTKNSEGKKYDLVVGAVGLNKPTLELFKSVCPTYQLPQITKTFICELYLEPALIDAYFGHSMHVFLLNLPNIKFGALIPKGSYVTLVLLGNEINKKVVERFLGSAPVQKCFPPGTDINSIMPCQCYPTININSAKTAYADRVVLIGDSSTSKLYKNGIGAAYITSKAAAKTVIFQGISENDFRKYYDPVCKKLDLDNRIGKGIFGLTNIIQKSRILKTGLYSMVVREQKKENDKRRMSSILWDTFTGSAPYADIFKRGLHPMVPISLLWNSLTGKLNGVKQQKNGK